MKTIYLDNNATTPVDPRVLEAMLPAFKQDFGNASSLTHTYGWAAAEMVKIARERVASLLNCSESELIFTSGATESNNLAIIGLVNARIKKSPGEKFRIITFESEHSSVLNPFSFIESFPLYKERVEVVLLSVGEEGQVDLSIVEKAIKDQKVGLVSCMLANNEIGTLYPLARLAEILCKKGIPLHCDATQALGRLPVDVRQLGVSLLSLSAHKMYGPKGAGALFIQKDMQQELCPILYGGKQESGLRAGTINVPAVVGLGKAAELVSQEQDSVTNHLNELSKLLLKLLRVGVSNLRLNGPEAERLPGNLNLLFPGVNASQLLIQIQTKLAFSLSSACLDPAKSSSHVLKAIGLDREQQKSCLRIGIGRFNTEEEIRLAAEVLLAAVRKSPLAPFPGAI